VTGRGGKEAGQSAKGALRSGSKHERGGVAKIFLKWGEQTVRQAKGQQRKKNLDHSRRRKKEEEKVANYAE